MAKSPERTYNYKVSQKKPKLTKEQKKALWLENKNKLGLNTILKPIIFLVFAITIEIVNFHILNITTTAGEKQLFPTYMFFDFGLWLIIAAIMLTCTRNWLSNTMFYFFTLFQIVICAVNATLYKDFGYLFTWDMIVLAVEGIDSFDISFIDFESALLYLALIIVFISIPIIIDVFGKKKQFEIKKLTRPILLLICFLSCFAIGTTSYTVQALTLGTGKNAEYKEIESDKYLFSNMHIIEESYRKFGTGGFYTKNLYDLTLGRLFVSGKDETINMINSQKVQVNEDAVLHGDNLVVIMLESFEWFAIDPYNTPNLWKLKTGTSSADYESPIPNKGVVIHDYVSNNKTNVSEDAAILGYMPHINQYKIGKNTYATEYSLPNLFRNLGYTANYFHNFLPKFYDRNVVNVNMGFEKFYSSADFVSPDGTKSDFNNFHLESDYIDQMINHLAPTDKKFMSFYTTVSSHGGYETYNSRFENHYQTYDNNLNNYELWLKNNGYVYPESEHYKNILRQYKAATMDTDVMVGKLFEHLKENNILDDTTVVIYSDHNAYFHNLAQAVKGTEIEDIGNLTTHNVPFMIYSSKLGSRDVYGFCNPYDIYPTICELFGLGYSTFFTQGYNMLTDDIENSLYVSYLTGYYNGKCYSKTMKNTVMLEGSTEADVATFKTNVCKFYQKQKYIEKVYRAGWKVK